MAGNPRKGGRHALDFGAPRVWRRHDGARGIAYAKAWRALTREFGEPERGSLLAMDMAGPVATAWISRQEAATDLEEARRQVAAGGRGRSRAEVARLEVRYRHAAHGYLEARTLLEQVGAGARQEASKGR